MCVSAEAGLGGALPLVPLTAHCPCQSLTGWRRQAADFWSVRHSLCRTQPRGLLIQANPTQRRTRGSGMWPLRVGCLPPRKVRVPQVPCTMAGDLVAFTGTLMPRGSQFGALRSHHHRWPGGSAALGQASRDSHRAHTFQP